MKRMTLVASLVLALAGISQAQGITLPFYDGFNGSISSSWQITNEDPTKYSLTENPGYLRIHATPTDLWGPLNTLKNLFTVALGQQDADSFTVTSKVSFPIPPYVHPQQGGVILLADSGGNPDMDNFIRIGYGMLDGCRRLQRTYETNGNPNGGAVWGPCVDVNTDPIWIRIVKSGTNYQVVYSLNGTEFITVDSFTAPLSVKFAGIYASCTWDDTQIILADFDFFQITRVPQPPFPVEDTMPPTGSVHAYPNALQPNNKLVTITLDGYVMDELSIARDGAGIGVSSAYLMVDGKKIILRDTSTDQLTVDGKYSVTIEVKAKKGAVYKVELYASDTNPIDYGGPNSGLVDSTYISVSK